MIPVDLSWVDYHTTYSCTTAIDTIGEGVRSHFCSFAPFLQDQIVLAILQREEVHDQNMHDCANKGLLS